MTVGEINSRFKEISDDEKMISRFCQSVKEDIDSMWLPELIKEIYLKGWEDGVEK